MRKIYQLLIASIILCLVCTPIMEAQVQQNNHDSQWYIANGKGWQRKSFVGLDNANAYSIQGVGYPNISCNDQAADHLFIIYADGSYYSNRPLSLGEGCYQSPDGDLAIQVSNTIRYLYASNIYDSDPPPSDIVVNGAEGFTNYCSLGVSSTDTLFANHSAVPGKDIALVVPQHLIENGDQVEISLWSSSGNSMVNVPYEGPLADTQPFPLRSESVIEAKDYYYFNYRVNPELVDIIRPSLDLYLKFSIAPKNESYIFERLEFGHDPNWIGPVKICEHCEHKYVVYNGQFYNETDIPADGLACIIDLPEIIEPSSVKFSKVYIGDRQLNTSQYNYDVSDRLLKLEKSLSIAMCKTDSSIVRFEFTAKIKSNEVASIDDLDLRIKEGWSIFHHEDTTERRFQLSCVDHTYELLKNRKKQRNISRDCEEIKDICITGIYLWIVAIIIMALLLFVLYNRFNNKSSKEIR